MPTLNGRNYTGVPGLNIRANNGTIRFETPTITPTVTSGERLLYVNSSNELIYQNGSSSTTIGAAGTGTPTWETIFAADATFTMTPDNTFTIAGNRATATDVVTITNIAGGSGSCLQITNSGSGNDIDGTSNTWGVTALGVATFTGLTLSGANTITTTGGDITWTLEDNDSTALIIGASGDTNMMTFDTSNAAPVVRFGDGMAVTDGLASFGSTSNTIANITVTNNTITTFGAAANAAGAVVIASTSLTTGSLLKLELSDTSNAGGFYLACRDTIGGTNDFTVGENGVVVALGTAGSNSFTLSNGDVLMSDGSLTITDADNAATLSITNNTATTASVFVYAGSGAFTGTTTTSFMTLTPSGLTTGTALYIACAAATTSSVAVDVTTATTTGTALRLATTGIQLDGAATGILTMTADAATTAGATAGRGLVSLSADALTTGTGVDITSTSLDLAAGELLNVEHIASGTLSVAKTGQLVDVTSSRTHTAATAISDDYDALSVIRTSVVNNAGGTLNAAGSCFYVENISTQTAGTMADTTNGLEVVMTGGAESAGYGLSITHTGTSVGRAISIAASQTTSTVMLMTANDLTTTGVGLSIASTGTGMTTGSLLRVSSGTTSAVATNGVVSFAATGAFTTTAVTDAFVMVNAASTLTGTIQAILGTALTTGVGLYIGSTGTGITSGSLLRCVSGTTDAIATNGAVLFQATGAHTSTSGVGFVNISDATATGNAMSIFANSLTTGTGLLVSSSGTITSAGQGLVNIVGTGITTGDALKIDLTEGTLTTGNYINCYDDTGATSVFRVAEDGIVTILGADGSASLTLSNGDLVLSDGAMASAVESVTCGVGAATFAVDSNVVRVTGDAGGNTITTITGGVAGQIVTLIFEDALVTINDDNTHDSNTIDLVGANTTFADDATLTLVYAAGSWYEVARSIND